jgi:hypothetical protein
MKIALNSRQWIILGLAGATGVIHLLLGFGILGNVDTLFILNGLGYLALAIGLFFIPQLAGQRSLLRWVLLAYTAVTFVLYFVFNWPEIWGPLGLLTKAIELILIILLLMDRNN